MPTCRSTLPASPRSCAMPASPEWALSSSRRTTSRTWSTERRSMTPTLEEAIRLVEEKADVDAGAAKFQQALAEGLGREDQATAHLHLGRARLIQQRFGEAKKEFQQTLQ